MLPDGVVAVVKRDCPTCTLVAPVLDQLDGSVDLTVFREDDDTGLEFSWRNDVETVPTLLRVEDGAEVARIVGCAFSHVDPPVVEYRACPMAMWPRRLASVGSSKTCATRPRSL